MKTLAVLAFFAIIGAIGITVVVQHTQSGTPTISVSPEVTCRVVTRRTFDSLARGKVTLAKAQALVNGACDALPAATRDAIIAAEKASAFARYATPTN